jgi:chemotaxis protein CheX
MYRESLIEVARMVWGRVLELEVLPSPDTARASHDRRVVAEVRFSGGWYGFVSAAVSEPLARRMAGIMLRAEPDRLAAEDVCDALKEIVNMLGGNMKALLPPPVRLALPQIVEARVVPRKAHGYVLSEWIALGCGVDVIELALGASPLPWERYYM